MFYKSKLAKAVKLTLLYGSVSTIGIFSHQGMAQEASAEESEVEKIAVTGSRIRKADFVSNAPVATIGAQQFELSATVNTESLLNTLPQVIPGLDRSSNNPGNGTATVDLRGLGTNRTLVLINGSRAVPSTPNNTVDINTIPTSLIQDVEVLTGGASAVYGSDAVAGVVNFILKDNFEGVNISASYEASEEGDAEIFSTDLTLGGNFADGKGNVVFNMSFTDRGEVFQGDRDFSFFALNENEDNSGLEPQGSSGIPATSIFNTGFEDFSSSTGIVFNEDGSIKPFVTSGESNDFYNFAPVNYLQLPQERHQLTGLGHFEINEYVEVYGRALFTDSRVPQQLAPTPIFQTATFTLDGNPFISPEAQQVISDAIGDGIDTDGDGIADTATSLLRRRMQEVGFRRNETSFTSYQFLTGIRGAVGDSDWYYDAYYSTGKVTNSAAQLGNINRDRWQQALLLETDDSGQVVLDSQGNPSCADTSANGSTVNCAPMNLFGENNISQEAADFIITAVASKAVFNQKILALNLSGDTGNFFELPGGPVGLAFGYEKQNYDFEFLPSQDSAAGTIAGFNGAPPVEGSYSVNEFYGEVYLPILEGLSFAELLDIELAYRSADYSTVGSVEATKIGGSWAPLEELRFRVGFNTAVRAPNIGELFLPRSEGFPRAVDPCSAVGEPDSAVTAICTATGVPAGSVGSPSLDLPSNQVRAFGGGNPNLKEEEADTLTVGFVYTPTEDLSLSLDYFDIEITDAVSAFGGGASNILQTCYDPTSSAGGAGSAFCNAITRRPDGLIFGVETASQNVATTTLKGFDLITEYGLDLYDGKLDISYLGTYTTEADFLPFEGGTMLECAGKFGTLCGQPVPEYKHRVTVRWSGDNLVTQLLWTHVGSVEDDDDNSDYFTESVNAYNLFELSTTYHLNDNYRVTARIDNLFDKEPPLMGGNGQQANTYPGTYDVFGRTYSLSMTVSF